MAASAVSSGTIDRRSLGHVSHWLGRASALVACGMAAACTYGPAELLVRVANSARRSDTDSIALAVYAAEFQRPTGLAAFPDGGRPRLGRERGIVYLCVAPGGAAVTVTRIAVLPRPDSLQTDFTPWIGSWDGAASVIVSIRGYAASETRADALRILWYRVRLSGAIEPLKGVAPTGGVATSMPPACEAAALADARAQLALRAGA
jgi:hypothetical protein